MKKREFKKPILSNLEAITPHFGVNMLSTIIGGNYDYGYDYGYDYDYDYIYDFGYLPELVVFPPGHQFFNMDATIAHLNANAHATTTHRCARYVRLALEVGGFFRTNHNLVSAWEWGGYLSSRGVPTVSFNDSFQPRVGDIAVFGAVQGHAHGHIQIWNGQQWVSDFRQNDFWPGSSYRNAFNNGTGSVTIFRQ